MRETRKKKPDVYKRQIYLRLAEATGEVMVCAVINGEDLPHKNELIEKLRCV